MDEELSENGYYKVDYKILEKIQENFWAGWFNEDETLKTIECIYDDYKYVSDTHTAVGIDVYDNMLLPQDLTPLWRINSQSVQV